MWLLICKLRTRPQGYLDFLLPLRLFIKQSLQVFWILFPTLPSPLPSHEGFGGQCLSFGIWKTSWLLWFSLWHSDNGGESDIFPEVQQSSGFFFTFRSIEGRTDKAINHCAGINTAKLVSFLILPRSFFFSSVLGKGNLTKAFIFLCGVIFAGPRIEYQGHMILGLRKSRGNKSGTKLSNYIWVVI